ncbi:MAG: DUF2620 domain-containing protein [Coriobacteriaceae bacterium]|nr:DUF2620 domain-containing protein [Coriobacteriaceae bacterium]
MRIAVGGLNRNEMEAAVRKAAPNAEVIPTNDMQGASLLKQGKADYYFGACNSGGGAAISILIGLVGYSKCCTVCKNGSTPNQQEIEDFVKQGKIVFGMTVDSLQKTVPLLVGALEKYGTAN